MDDSNGTTYRKDTRAEDCLVASGHQRAGRRRINTFTFEGPEAYEDVLEKLPSYCSPKNHETYECYVSRVRVQGEGEEFDSFYGDLLLNANTYEFESLTESVTSDQVL